MATTAPLRRTLIVLAGLALLAALTWRVYGVAAADPGYAVPHDAQVEASTGVRFTQAALVADGGLVELRYVVLDTQKATAFQGDTKHPPTLRNEGSGKVAWRPALMRQGHELRPGQTYTFLYLNNQNAIHRGDRIEIRTGGHQLTHVPVR